MPDGAIAAGRHPQNVMLVAVNKYTRRKPVRVFFMMQCAFLFLL